MLTVVVMVETRMHSRNATGDRHSALFFDVNIICKYLEGLAMQDCKIKESPVCKITC